MRESDSKTESLDLIGCLLGKPKSLLLGPDGVDEVQLGYCVKPALLHVLGSAKNGGTL